MIPEIILALFSGLLFSVMASFSDSFSWRIYRAYYSAVRKSIPDKLEYILRKKSSCEFCSAPVKVAGLIPIAGYFLMRGKCHECGRNLSPRFPVLEFIAFIYGMAIALRNSEPWFVFFTLGALVPLYIICVTDYRKYLIPTEAILVLLVMAMVELLFFRSNVFSDHGREWFVLHLSSAFVLYFLFHLIRLLSGKQMGLADVRLALAYGLFLGFPAVLFLPVVSAGTAILFYFTRKNSIIFGKSDEEKIPFGVFLSLAFLLLRFV